MKRSGRLILTAGAFTLALLVPLRLKAQEFPVNPNPLLSREQPVKEGSNDRTQLKVLSVLMRVYYDQNERWPETWGEIENVANVPVWNPPEIQPHFVRSFALIRNVKGQKRLPGGRAREATYILVSVTPVVREVYDGYTETGRWAFWVSESGQLFTEWQREEDIRTFSGWKDVEAAINDYLRNQKSSEPEGSEDSLSSSSRPDTDPSDDDSRKKVANESWWSAIAVLALILVGTASIPLWRRASGSRSRRNEAD